MILSLVENIPSVSPLIKSSYLLATKLGKPFGVLMLKKSAEEIVAVRAAVETLLQNLSIRPDYLAVCSSGLDALHTLCEQHEVSFLFVQLCGSESCRIRKYLKAGRDLRIPYLFYKDGFSVSEFNKVLIPVNFLIEEIEKAQFAAAFGRFCNAALSLFQAKDYGSKAASNVLKISSVLDKFGLKYQIVQGRKDSFKIEADALRYAIEEAYDLLIVSASREYGLDDIIFGPKELHLIKKASIPIMLINPRGDLYVLCE